MSLNRMHAITIVTWFIVVLASLGVRVEFAAGPLSWAEVSGWMALAVFPVITLLMAFRGAAPPTIAQVLYETENPAGSVKPVARQDDSNVPRS